MVSKPVVLPLKLEKIPFTKACTKAKSKSLRSAFISNVGDGVLLLTVPANSKWFLPRKSDETILASIS